MTKKHDSTDSSDKPSDVDEIRAELDAIQHHIKKLLNAGSNMLLDQTTGEMPQPVKKLEKQIKKNPLAAALGALIGGIILGRIFKSCRKKH